MNIFDILNSQYVTQTHYDTILTQQKAYIQFINSLPDQVSSQWIHVREAGILDLCYQYYKDYAKQNNLFSLKPIEQLQQLVIEVEGQQSYVSDFIQFMNIDLNKNDNILQQIAIVINKFKLNYDFNQRSNLCFNDQYKVITIELLRQYAEQVYLNDDGMIGPFLNQLIEFGSHLQSIKEIPSKLVEEIHSEQSIKCIFESVLYYPDTTDHLQEFRQTIQLTKMYRDMENSLQSAIKKRLLISGVNTETILKFYINLLKVLQFVDPDCFIFEKVTKPLKEYLLQRSDFLRCIIGILTEENYKTERVMVYEQQDSSDDECAKEKDLTTVLVSLYGSQEAFISEYQNMVAEKILTPKEFNLQQEFANIELMKIRFGEQQMQTCTIMMKDIYESKRIDQNIQFNVIHPLFLSKTFWPISYDFKPTFKLPTNIEELFVVYQKKFEKLKTMRSLLWHHDLGSVTLTLDFDNGEFEFKCLPVHAAIIGLFNEIPDWLSVETLSQKLQMTHEDLRRRIQFWVQKGVLIEDQHSYKAVDVYKPQNCDDQLDVPEDLFVSSTTFLQSNELIQQISQYVLDLLKLTGSLQVCKIVQIFKTTFKSELPAVTENNIKEAIKLLIQKGKLGGSDYIELK